MRGHMEGQGATLAPAAVLTQSSNPHSRPHHSSSPSALTLYLHPSPSPSPSTPTSHLSPFHPHAYSHPGWAGAGTIFYEQSASSESHLRISQASTATAGVQPSSLTFIRVYGKQEKVRQSPYESKPIDSMTISNSAVLQMIDTDEELLSSGGSVHACMHACLTGSCCTRCCSRTTSTSYYFSLTSYLIPRCGSLPMRWFRSRGGQR